MKLFVVATDEKCGGCNWRVGVLYLMGEDLDDAMRNYHENERGLCGDCMCGLLKEIDALIITKHMIRVFLASNLGREPTDEEIRRFREMLGPDVAEWFQTNYTDFEVRGKT